MCERERECVCARESACVRERVCACVCEREREREVSDVRLHLVQLRRRLGQVVLREGVGECVSEREGVCVLCAKERERERYKYVYI